ncbi:MAG: hypothetical protein RR139_12030 [Lachnospiraceae bacterium]
MKKLLQKAISTTLILSMILPGCGSKNSADSITTDINYSQSAPGFFIETETGYYFSSDNYFYYSDKDKINFVKLCSKPDCTHKDSNCNAYNYDSGCNTHFYNGKLVYPYHQSDEFNSEIVIASKNADGTDTKQEKVIEVTPGFYSGKMHRNYFVYNLIETDEKTGSQHSRLYIQRLDQLKEDPKVAYEYIQEEETKNAEIVVFAMVEESLFFRADGSLFQYEIGTEKLVEIPEESQMKKGEYFTKDRIYQVDMEDNFYYQDLKTGEIVQLKKEEDPNIYGPFQTDGERMYRLNYSYGDTVIPDEYNGIFIYDMEGNPVDYAKYSIPTDNQMYFVAAEDKVFVFRIPGGGPVTSYSYFNKEDIGTGDIKWTDVDL